MRTRSSTLVLAALSIISLLGGSVLFAVVWITGFIDPIFRVSASWGLVPMLLCGLGFGISSFMDIRRQIRSRYEKNATTGQRGGLRQLPKTVLVPVK